MFPEMWDLWGQTRLGVVVEKCFLPGGADRGRTHSDLVVETHVPGVVGSMRPNTY